MIVPQNDDDTTGPVAPSMKLKLLQQTRNAMNTKDFHVEDNLGRDDMVHFRIRPGVQYQLGIPIQRRKSGNEITLEIIGKEWENAPRYIVFEDNLPARVEDLNAHYSEQHPLWEDPPFMMQCVLYKKSETGNIEIPEEMMLIDAVDQYGVKYRMRMTPAKINEDPPIVGSRAFEKRERIFSGGGTAAPTTTTASTSFSTTAPRKMTKQEFAEKIRLLRQESGAAEVTNASRTPSYRELFGKTSDPNRLLTVEEIEIERKEFEQRLGEGKVFCVPDDDNEQAAEEESVIVVESTE